MQKHNILLERQIKKYNIDPSLLINSELTNFLKSISASYDEFEEERVLLERSIEISSKEYQINLENTRNIQAQIIQTEKMAGIGQLSAGIAHEINNPLAFIQSNIETLQKYLNKICEMQSMSQGIIEDNKSLTLDDFVNKCESLKEFQKKNKMKYIWNDIPIMMAETSDGLGRIEKIVKSLLGFARKGLGSELAEYDLNKGILDTITIANNEIKYYATVITNLGDIPVIDVFGGAINQVILNLIINSAHAIKSKENFTEIGEIKVSTFIDNKNVILIISDNGSGMPKELVDRIFEPFFTTKPIGTGTGLGLSVVRDIIVEKHRGVIQVDSVIGEGTTFTITLPIKQDV